MKVFSVAIDLVALPANGDHLSLVLFLHPSVPSLFRNIDKGVALNAVVIGSRENAAMGTD
jgi:hypothetical protein